MLAAKTKTGWRSTAARTPDKFRWKSSPYNAENSWLSYDDDRRLICRYESDDATLEVYAIYVPFSCQKSFANKANAKPDQIRLTGPVQFLEKLLNTWHLSRADAIPLLGLEETERAYVDDLLAGRDLLKGRDLKHRIASLFRIRKTLYSLFRDEKAENDWLREPHDALDGQKPMDIMLEGSMENLLLVKEYVEAAAGL